MIYKRLPPCCILDHNNLLLKISYFIESDTQIYGHEVQYDVVRVCNLSQQTTRTKSHDVIKRVPMIKN